MMRRVVIVVTLALAAGGLGFAQGTQTATITGTVTGPGGATMPGVSVTATSPSQLGGREAFTQSNGTYVFRGLTPGTYAVRFAHAGMEGAGIQVLAPLGGTVRADAVMRLATAKEKITVEGEARPALETMIGGLNVTRETTTHLPIARTPLGIATLAAGVVGDRGGHPIAAPGINGGFSYDNSILVNGANIQIASGGAPMAVHIEDTILETQVLTSGIPAEYGHFTGGVINLITRNGGNDFSGSLRADFSRADWRAETPYEDGYRGEGVARGAPVPRTGELGEVYTATLGGPLLRDRFWFFGALRDQKYTATASLPLSAERVPRVVTNRRIEGKLSAELSPGHAFQGSYIESPIDMSHELLINPLTVHAISRNTLRDQEGGVFSYAGVLADTLFAEARYSEKSIIFSGIGGTSRDIVDSPFRSLTSFSGVAVSGGTFNAPYFDRTDAELHANEQMSGSLSWLAATRAGTHDVKGGVERFTVTRTGGNSQSSTNYVFFSGYEVVNGVPQYDANGSLIPMFNPRQPGRRDDTRLAYWVATRGATLDITTDSLFLQDRWDLSARWSLSLGARHERVRSEATGGIEAIDTTTTVPRLGVAFDPGGDGRFKLDVTYAEYAGAYSPSIVGANSTVGNPNLLYGYYTGPAGAGRDFAPGFDPANYTFYYARVPTANKFIEEDLSSPVNQELSLSAGMALGRGGWLKATLVERRLKNVLEDFVTIDQGCTEVVFEGVAAGCFDNVTLRNSNVPERTYQAVQLQGRGLLARAWTVQGTYTHQLKNHGTTEGAASAIGDQPEVQSPREIAYGRLSFFQAHKVRLWTTYELGFGRAGTLSGGLMYRYDSPEVFSYVTSSIARTAIQRARDPGYKNVPRQTLYYGGRGAGEFNEASLVDISLGYAIPLMRNLETWVKVDVLNVLNDDTQLRWNTTVNPDPASALDEDGLRTGYVKAATFGRPRSATDYVVPREYFISAGVRF